MDSISIRPSHVRAGSIYSKTSHPIAVAIFQKTGQKAVVNNCSVDIHGESFDFTAETMRAIRRMEVQYENSLPIDDFEVEFE